MRKIAYEAGYWPCLDAIVAWGLDAMAQAVRGINADLDDTETFLNDYGIRR